MWMYFLVFVATLFVDSIPVFAPPAWTVLVLLLLLFHLNPWIVVIIGVTGSTLGRYILSVYIPKVSSGLVNRREDKNLRYVGGKLTKAPFAAAIFVFLYTLTPLSTTALFTAAGIARVNPWHILPPFFFGSLFRLVLAKSLCCFSLIDSAICLEAPLSDDFDFSPRFAASAAPAAI